MRALFLTVPPVLMAAVNANFKEIGSPRAPISIEIYTDYQCPHCRAFYMEVMPEFMKEYVTTGKVRIVHRDFPLQTFAHSRQAARFANAAGQIGRYELVADQIFRTQEEWAQNGNIDAQVAKVLPPGDMQKVRELVKSDAHLDDTVTADVVMAAKDNITQTPSLAIVHNGTRQHISGGMPLNVLKSYVDQLLAKK